MTRVAGLVLAAGQGSRMGRPKALVRSDSGTPWTGLAVRALRAGGCADVTVVLGAAAQEARELLADRPDVTIVTAPDWHRGLSASLRAGLGSLRTDDAGDDVDEGDPAGVDAVLVTLVDTPGLPTAAVARVLGAGPVDRLVLRRAVHRGRPGHPVLIGRAHWGPLVAELSGDEGAGPYLRSHGAGAVECGDLWDGEDRDTAGAGGPASGGTEASG